MRKFTKILTVCLAVVAILTAFTVIALAADAPISFTSASDSVSAASGGAGTFHMGTFETVDAGHVFGSKLNKNALYTMSDREFNNTYMKFLNKTIDKHSMQETKMIMKVLYPNNSDDVINDMVKSLFKVENEGEGYGKF